MRRLVVALSAAALAMGTALTPSPASAADGDFGNSCTAGTGPGNTTGVMIAKGAANPLPITAPMTGVITKATIALPGVLAVGEVVKTLRATGNPNEYTVIAESEPFIVGPGTVAYPVRVPVTAGDLLGI